jgi:hypothetical protein
VTIINNIISDNVANYNAGGIRCNYNSNATIINNIIYNNVAGNMGGGFFCNIDSVASISNTILFNNSAPFGSEIAVGGDPSTLTISFSNVDGGKSSVFVDPNSILNWGSGMIDADPLFEDPTNNDFHLTYPSPCKDTGDNAAVTEPTDFEGDPRIAFGTADMGADEFYTHLYWTGDAKPGWAVDFKFVGLPYASPVGLWIGTGVLDPPLKSMWGDWYLQFPIFGPIIMPVPIPSSGILILPGVIPGSPPAPYSLPMQALIGSELTNLCILEVK